jgi:hypothetical protein
MRYATEGFLDRVFNFGIDSGFGFTAVVGARCYDSNWLRQLVVGLP